METMGGRNCRVLERKVLDVDKGQVSFTTEKDFILERVKYLDSPREYGIYLITPQNTIHAYESKKIGNLQGSKRMFKNISDGVEKMQRHIFLGTNIFSLD